MHTIEITSSLDWAIAESEILACASKFGCYDDTIKLLLNIDKLVAKLSNAEIAARRNHDKPSRNDKELVVMINKEIDFICKMLFFASLYK